MAGNAVIGALRVVLGADLAALERGLKDAQGSLSNFGGHFAKVAAVAGAAMVALGAGVAVAVRGQLEEFDKLSKLGQSIGVPVEQLSALRYAAKLSAVDLDQLGTGVARLARNAVEAGQGLTTPIRAFEALQINFRNTAGGIKTVSELLPEIADRFARMKDGSEKTAFAQQLLGRAGAALIPLLNQGSTGLKEMTNEARALGVVLDDKTAAAAVSFNDNMTRLSAVASGFFTQVTAQLAPALRVLSGDLVNAAKNSDLVTTAAKGLASAIQSVIGVGLQAGLFFERFSIEAQALWQVLKAPSVAEATKAWKGFVAAGDETEQRFKSLGSYLDGFWKRVQDNADETKNKIKDAFNPKIVNDVAQKAAASQLAAQEKKDISELKSIFEATRTPTEEFALTIQKLNLIFANGAKDPETYARAVAQAQDKLVSANPYAQALGSSLESAFDRATQKGAKFGDVLRGLLTDLARAVANTAFRQLLFGNAAQGGTSTGIMGSFFSALPHFASGGSFTVGGAGGIDSQLVAFHATPGERVAVTNGGMGDHGGGSTLVQVNNYAAGTETRQRRESGPSGEVVIVDVVKKAWGRGEFDAVQRGRSGLRPQKIR